MATVVGRSHVWVLKVETGLLAPSRQDRDRLSEALGIELSEMPTREDFEP